MKNLRKFCMGSAVLAMTACSDEPVGNSSEPTDWELGKDAYMTINIIDANSGSRSIEDGGFEFGDFYTESDVVSARFFFFDANKVFVCEASRWIEGGMNNPDGNTNKDQNIEHFGKSTLVIRNNGNTTAPKYLLTVLNAPTGFQPKSTLDATAKTLEVAATWSEGTGDSKKTHFVMCTTSYYGESETHDNDTYFANVIDPKYFYSEPVPENLQGKNVLNVYVERLAVKVQVVIDDNLGGDDDKEDDINGETYYKLPLTVGGNENGPVSDITAATEIWVKFIGWGLNSTAKQTYLAKQLPAVTSETTTLWEPFKGWNDASNFRSYWGQGVAYDKDIEAVVNNPYINFVSAPTLTGNVVLASEITPANAAYCNEYTNTPDKIFKEVKELVNGTMTPVNRVIPAKTTSVALKAVAYEKDKNGKFTPLNLVMHNGILFKQPNYRAYLLNTIDQAKKLNFYTYVGTVEIPVEGYTPTTEDKFTQIDETYFVLASAGLGTGTVKVVPNLPEGTKLYEQKADGKFYPIANPATALQTVLDEAQNVETWGKSIAYTDGLMAYTIPVEHLNADKTNLGEGETNPDDQKREGYYGVVRNHWYKVTVTKLTRIGRGIFVPGDGSQENPCEPIIPDEPDDPTYYLGAKVSILSWKIVNQSAGI